MNTATRIKICGLTRKEDIARALELGADYGGVIVFDDSPRAVSAEKARALAAAIPKGKRVLVDVAPSPERLAAHQKLGFDFYQIHFDPAAVPPAAIAAWIRTVGRPALWLAPRVPYGTAFPEYLIEVADTFVIDAYQAGVYGGTGKVGNWGFFAREKEAFPENKWVLAGGLTPENIAKAIVETHADIVDVSSGVEASPGRKDPAKLAAFFAAARTPAQ